MNRIQPIYDITITINDLLVNDISPKNRQEVIDEINTLLSKRGSFMEKAIEPFTEEERELGEKLLPFDQEIKQKMNDLFMNMKNEMKQVRKQKQTNHKYINPYENIQTVDGMFMDKKK